MERYTTSRKLGDGAFGSVILATSKKSGAKVAIKHMKQKYYTWEECLALREVRSLKKLKHSNIVKLLEVFRENDELFFVFEYMESNLFEDMKSRSNGLQENEIRNIMFQLFLSVDHMHRHGFFHRDLKPENVLITGAAVKLADFGLARETRSRPPYTEYVSTRWYRAPEIALRGTHYNSPVDVWALGAMMAELYTGTPLFPGNNETDQLFKICSVLGTPGERDWEDGHTLAHKMGFRFPHLRKTELETLVPQAGDEALDVMRACLRWNPQHRSTTQKILAMPFFRDAVNGVSSKPTPFASRTSSLASGASDSGSKSERKKEPEKSAEPRDSSVSEDAPVMPVEANAPYDLDIDAEIESLLSKSSDPEDPDVDVANGGAMHLPWSTSDAKDDGGDMRSASPDLASLYSELGMSPVGGGPSDPSAELAKRTRAMALNLSHSQSMTRSPSKVLVRNGKSTSAKPNVFEHVTYDKSTTSVPKVRQVTSLYENSKEKQGVNGYNWRR